MRRRNGEGKEGEGEEGDEEEEKEEEEEEHSLKKDIKDKVCIYLMYKSL